MTAEAVCFVLLAWLLTYALHSTLLLGLAWLASARLRIRSHRVREGLWRLALLGGLATASVQLATSWRPYGGLWSLGAPGREVARAAPAPDLAGEGEPLRWTHLQLDASDRAPATPATQATPVTKRRAVVLNATRSHAQHAAPVALADRASRADANGRGQPATPRRVEAIVEVRAEEPLPRREGELALLGSLASANRGSREGSIRPPAWLGPLLAAGWLAGAAGGLLALAVSRRRLHDRLRGRVELRGGRLPDLLARLKRRARIRRPVRLTCSPRIATPISLGLARAEICVPLRAVTDLGPDEQESMLAHELAHVVRRDAAWLHVYEALSRVLFFQPLNRLAQRRIQESTECLCDDWAVARTGRRLALARCLTQVAGWVVRRPAALPAPCMAHASAPLTQRVERLLAAERPRGEGRTVGLAACAGALLAAVAVGAPGVSAFDAERETAPAADAVYAVRLELQAGDERQPDGPQAAFGLALPEVPHAIVRATPAASEAGVHVLFARLDREVTLLEHELAGLREELESRCAPEPLCEALDSMERTLDELRGRRAELRVRLEHAGHALLVLD